MLIKFLSFVITVIGTTRYKTVFLSCLAIVLSFTGVTAVALVRNGQTRNAASKVAQAQSQAQNQDSAPQLTGISKQKTKTQDTSASSSENTNQQDNSTPPANAPSSSTSTATNNTTTPVANPDIILSKTDVALNIGNGDGSTQAITAALSDNSNATWAIVAPDNATTIRAFIDQTSATGISFHIHADNVPAGTTTYQFTVTAKDTSRNLNLSKVISVTVVSQ